MQVRGSLVFGMRTRDMRYLTVGFMVVRSRLVVCNGDRLLATENHVSPRKVDETTPIPPLKTSAEKSKYISKSSADMIVPPPHFLLVSYM